MILEYIPLSHPERATCKYRREDAMRVRSHRCTVFGSFGDSRKPDEEQCGVQGTQQDQSTGAQDVRMKGKTCAWRMEFQVHLGWKLHNSFPRRNVAAGEINLYSTECNGC